MVIVLLTRLTSANQIFLFNLGKKESQVQQYPPADATDFNNLSSLLFHQSHQTRTPITPGPTRVSPSRRFSIARLLYKPSTKPSLILSFPTATPIDL